jgi:hypothetical protein
VKVAINPDPSTTARGERIDGDRAPEYIRRDLVRVATREPVIEVASAEEEARRA